MKKNLFDKIFTWYILLTKRLFKKKSFVLVLLLLPCLSAGLLLVSTQESGVLTVALVAEKKEAADKVGENTSSKQLIKRIRAEKSIIRFVEADSEEEADRLILSHQADAAWIFPESLEKAAASYLSGSKPIVKVVQKDEGVLYALSREIIYKNIFPYISYAVYKSYMYNIYQKKIPEAEFDSKINAAYNSIEISDNLVRFAYIDSEENLPASNYLLSPLRGLMAVWLVLCGFAAAMYYKSDEEAKLFIWIEPERRFFLALAYILCVLFIAGITVLSALAISGSFISFRAELVNMLLLILAASGFCNLLRLLCKNMYLIAVFMPVSLISMIVLSPIFADAGLRKLQLLNPVFYYLNLFYSKGYRFGFIIYIILLYVLGLAADRLLAGMQR